MAGSQNVVGDLWGSLQGFKGDPWLVPKVWFGDLRGSLQGFKGDPWLVHKVWSGDLWGSLRGFWGLGLRLGPPPGTPGDMTVDLGIWLWRTRRATAPLLSDFGASAWDCRVARDPLELWGPPGTAAKKLKNDQMIPPKGLLTGNSRGPPTPGGRLLKRLYKANSFT